MLLLFFVAEAVVELPPFVEATTQRADHSVAAFDARAFDPLTFDCLAARIRPTLGGWVKEAPQPSKWAPNDLARGTQWAKPRRGTSTW